MIINGKYETGTRRYLPWSWHGPGYHNQAGSWLRISTQHSSATQPNRQWRVSWLSSIIRHPWFNGRHANGNDLLSRSIGSPVPVCDGRVNLCRASTAVTWRPTTRSQIGRVNRPKGDLSRCDNFRGITLLSVGPTWKSIKQNYPGADER